METDYRSRSPGRHWSSRWCSSVTTSGGIAFTNDEYQFSTATLGRAREERVALDEWPGRRADPHRVRAALLARWFRSLAERLRA